MPFFLVLVVIQLSLWIYSHGSHTKSHYYSAGLSVSVCASTPHQRATRPLVALCFQNCSFLQQCFKQAIDTSTMNTHATELAFNSFLFVNDVFSVSQEGGV